MCKPLPAAFFSSMGDSASWSLTFLSSENSGCSFIYLEISERSACSELCYSALQSYCLSFPFCIKHTSSI